MISFVYLRLSFRVNPITIGGSGFYTLWVPTHMQPPVYVEMVKTHDYRTLQSCGLLFYVKSDCGVVMHVATRYNDFSMDGAFLHMYIQDLF